MSASAETPSLTLPAPPPSQDRRRGFPWKTVAALILLAALVSGGSVAVWRLWLPESTAIQTVAVARGDIAVFLAESGVVESTSNATVKCEVEALLGTVSSNTGTTGGMGNNGRSGTSQQTTGTTGTATATSGTGTGTGVASAAGGSSGSRSGGGSASGGGAGASGSGASGGGSSGGSQRPVIQSFNYVIAAHVPTRLSVNANSGVGSTRRSQGGQMGSQSGGGSSSMMMMGGEKNGSTTILTIIPEGASVKAGQVVCELDKAPFEDELRNQVIRYDQAKAAYDQVKYALEVNKIATQEYISGVLPQDKEAIRIYEEQCKSLTEQARKTYAWSKAMEKRKLRNSTQVQADFIAVEQNEINLAEASGMKERLEKFAAPRILKELEAKGEAIRADLLSKESSLMIENERKERLEKAIANCTLVAPRDGIISYVNVTSPWGSVDYRVEPGAVVREGQAIFNLPDPKEMRIKCKVNETKVAKVQIGMPVKIQIDAIADRVFDGKVTELTAIPAPAEGPISEIHVYYAMISIDTGDFDGLKPGLSALVHFAADFENDVPVVPVSAVRWIDRTPFVAVLDGESPAWRPVTLGLTNEEQAEVKTGLKEGERVVLNPEDIPELATRATGAPQMRKPEDSTAGDVPRPVQTSSR